MRLLPLFLSWNVGLAKSPLPFDEHVQVIAPSLKAILSLVVNVAAGSAMVTVTSPVFEL